MTAELDFADWPLQTVTWKAKTSRDQYGQPTYGVAVSLKGYVTYLTEEQRQESVEGEKVHGAVFLLTAPVVDTEDQITLPDGTIPIIFAVQRLHDERGNAYYTKVLFGATETRF